MDYWISDSIFIWLHHLRFDIIGGLISSIWMIFEEIEFSDDISSGGQNYRYLDRNISELRWDMIDLKMITIGTSDFLISDGKV